jgi:hypothetical protein
MPTSQDFQYDVFLSHSMKDKAVVRPLSERLRKDGLHDNPQLSTFTLNQLRDSTTPPSKTPGRNSLASKSCGV